ncbi:MAG: hypothetical protein IJZ90_01590 [Clostridia bacterium]|nr:hypothetical protein [Clostridia bacterium]
MMYLSVVSTENIVSGYTDELNAIESQLQNVETAGGEINASQLLSDALNGEFNLSPLGVAAAVLKELMSYLTDNMEIVLTLLVIALVSSFMFVFCSQKSSLTEIGNSAAGIITAVFIASFFVQTVVFTADSAEGMESVMLSVLPLLAALGLSKGSTVFVLCAQCVSLAISYVFIPLAAVYGALGFAEPLTDKFPVKELRVSVKSFFTWGLGLTMTIFSCITAITGAVVSQFAGVTGKTVKYAGNLVPFVGSYLSESADLVFSGINALRSASGIGASAAVFITGISPFLKLLAYVTVLRIASFFIRPFAASSMRSVVDNTSEAVTMLMGMTALMGAFFIINIAVFTSIRFGG